VLVKIEDFLAAELPAIAPVFQFEAFIEFGYLSDYWKVPGAQVFGGDPVKGRKKVEEDVERVGVSLASGACRLGYVVVFEECDWGFEERFAATAETQHHGCGVRFIRSHEPARNRP
jgi:hypothetical protein